MSESTPPLRPKMPTAFDLVGMPDTDFERMCFELVRLEFPGVVKPSNTRDGGADAGLPNDNGGYERCWQAKHFKGKVRWDNWKESLEDAQRNWGMTAYTFCFPREFTDPERQTFDRHFRQPGATVKVSYWSGAALHARLTNSEEGRRVARTFFDHSDLDTDRVLRAVESGGKLDTGEDALDRLLPVGDFLKTRDAYFSYPVSVQESDRLDSSPEDAVMHIDKVRDGVTARTSLVPRSDEAMEHYGPKFRLQPSDDAAADEAWPGLVAALNEGRSIQLGSGVDLTFTQMPPAFEHMVGKKLTGARLTLTAARVPPPFEARIEVNSDRGHAIWDVLLEPQEPPSGWDAALIGEVGGMTTSLFLEVREDGSGRARWDFTYRRDQSPAATQLAALRFLRVLGGRGEVIISDRGTTKRPTRRSPTQPHPFPEDGEAFIAFFEDIVTVEKWAKVSLPMSLDVSAEEVRALATLAHGLRNGGWAATWHDVTLTGDEKGLASFRDGGNIRVDQNLWATLLGKTFQVGHVRHALSAYTVVDATPLPDGQYSIRLKPPDAEAARFFQEVRKGPIGKKPPPPPPRRGKPKPKNQNKRMHAKKRRRRRK